MTEHYHLIDEAQGAELLFPTREEAYEEAMAMITDDYSLTIHSNERIEWNSPFGRVVIVRCERGTCVADYEQLGDE